jgi:hypothetical protein
MVVQSLRAMIVQSSDARDLLRSVKRVCLHHVDNVQIVFTILTFPARNGRVLKIAALLS